MTVIYKLFENSEPNATTEEYYKAPDQTEGTAESEEEEALDLDDQETCTAGYERPEEFLEAGW